MSHNWYASTNNTFSFRSTSNDLASNNNSPLSSNANNSSKTNRKSFNTTIIPWIYGKGNRNTSTIAIHLYFLLIFCSSFCLLCTAEKFTLSSMTLASTGQSFSVAVVNNTLYIFDGTNDTEFQAPFNYNLSGNVIWVTKNIPDFYFDIYSSPTFIRYDGQCVLQIEGTVYGMFPYTPNLQYRAMMKYSLTNSYFGTNTYDAVRSSTRDFGSCTAFNSQLNIIYSIGRYFTEYYNLSNDSWAYISDPNQKTLASGCAMDINSQYIFKFGGIDISPVNQDIIEKYDVNSGGWEILFNVKLKQIIAYLRCILYKNVDNKIYCTGGHSSVYLSAVHVFDPESLTIDFVSYQLNVGRGHHRMILYDQCIFVIGGYYDLNPLDSIEYLCLNPPSASPSALPTALPTDLPTALPTIPPTMQPSLDPTAIPSESPTNYPSTTPTELPTNGPSTIIPSNNPSTTPTELPTNGPSTNIPSNNPTSTKAITDSKDQYSTEFILVIAVSILSFLLIAGIVYVCWVRYKKRRKAGLESGISQVTKGAKETPLQIQMTMENKNVDNLMTEKEGQTQR